MKTKAELSSFVDECLANIDLKNKLRTLVRSLERKGLPQIEGFFDRENKDALSLLVSKYGVPAYVLRVDESIRNRWEKSLLSGTAFYDAQHPIWKGDDVCQEPHFLESLKLHLEFNQDNGLLEREEPWAHSEKTTALECLEFMDHQTVLLSKASSGEHTYVSLSCQLIEPGGPMKWDVYAVLERDLKPIAQLTGSTLALDCSEPCNLDPKEVFKFVDIDYPGQYLEHVIKPLLEDALPGEDNPLAFFQGRGKGSALLHVDRIECHELSHQIDVLELLLDSVMSALVDSEKANLESTINAQERGLLNKPSSKFVCTGISALVIESPIADMIELTHHLTDPEMLREVVHGSVELDRTLVELTGRLKQKLSTSGGWPCTTMFTPILDGERILRIGEQTLLKSLESDLFDDDY